MSHLEAFFPAGPSSSAAAARHAADMVAEFEQAQVGHVEIVGFGGLGLAVPQSGMVMRRAGVGAFWCAVQPYLLPASEYPTVRCS